MLIDFHAKGRRCHDFSWTSRNMSAKRRLCGTVEGRFIDGSARCCAVFSTARSRAAAMSNLARSTLSLALRALLAGTKSSALVNFMICPVAWVANDHDQILPLDHGHLTAIGCGLSLAPGRRVAAR